MTGAKSMKAPPCRAVVTCTQLDDIHQEPAVTVHVIDRETQAGFLDPKVGATRTLWTSTQTPENNTPDHIEPMEWTGPSIIPNGTHCKVVDLAPGAITKIHRSNALDYNIVTKGTLTLITPKVGADEVHSLEDESLLERTQVRQGDVCVQRGTMHAWHNETSEWTRHIAVITSANPVCTAAAGELAMYKP